jgi:D-3-phosphoglycerate dehydrogenase
MTAPGELATTGRRLVGLACTEDVRRRYVDDHDLERLQAVADFSYRAFDVESDSRDPVAEAELGGFAAPLDALHVCHGAPFVSSAVLEQASGLTLLGDLEGDRFASRLDLDAAHGRGIRVVDTSHASSYPTAEWALALALISLRNAGALFREMIAHKSVRRAGEQRSGPGYEHAELSHKRVGMVGFGHLARRLVELLRPFQVEIRAYDPYVSRALAEAYGVLFADLPNILESDVVFVLVPHTPSTEGMLGASELERLRPGSAFVNVSRGRVVDSEALVARLARGDVLAGLDVFDPEPIPLDSPLLDMPNVFLSPHIAGVTEESRRRFFALMVDECLRHFMGFEPLSELTTSTARERPRRL